MYTSILYVLAHLSILSHINTQYLNVGDESSSGTIIGFTGLNKRKLWGDQIAAFQYLNGIDTQQGLFC